MENWAIRCGCSLPAESFRGADTIHSLTSGPASQLVTLPDFSRASAEAVYFTPAMVRFTLAVKPLFSRVAGLAAVAAAAAVARYRVRVSASFAVVLGNCTVRTAWRTEPSA